MFTLKKIQCSSACSLKRHVISVETFYIKQNDLTMACKRITAPWWYYWNLKKLWTDKSWENERAFSVSRCFVWEIIINLEPLSKWKRLHEVVWWNIKISLTCKVAPTGESGNDEHHMLLNNVEIFETRLGTAIGIFLLIDVLSTVSVLARP